MAFEMLQVRAVSRAAIADLILHRHYAKRWPSISFAFGLFNNNDLIGAVSYGTPSSAPLRAGLLGKDHADWVLELNRLCLVNNAKNEASFLISKSLKMLPQPSAIISFADISQGHTGYVYQACNFLYCGLSAKRTDWKVKGMEHLHGQTIADKFRGVSNRAQAMRDEYGDSFYLAPRPRKHRYVFFAGTRAMRKQMKSLLRYPVLPYPKG